MGLLGSNSIVLVFDGSDTEVKCGQQATDDYEVDGVDEEVDPEAGFLSSQVLQEGLEIAEIKAFEHNRSDEGQQHVETDQTKDGLGSLSFIEYDGSQCERKNAHAPAHPCTGDGPSRR